MLEKISTDFSCIVVQPTTSSPRQGHLGIGHMLDYLLQQEFQGGGKENFDYKQDNAGLLVSKFPLSYRDNH